MTVNVSTKPREKCAACTFTPKPIELLKRISEINIFNNNMNSCCHLLLMRLASLESELSRAELSTAQHSSGKANTWNPKRTASVGINAVSVWCNWKEEEKQKENHSVSTIIKVPATSLMSIAPYAHRHTFIINVFIRSYRISQFLPCTDKINEGEYIDRTHISVLQYRFICAYAYCLVSFFCRMEFFLFLCVSPLSMSRKCLCCRAK